VENKINALSNFILEAAFLDPVRLRKLGKMILLTTVDENQHKKQFLHHREKLFDFNNNEFRAARLLQQCLIKEAKHLGVEIINNDKVK